MDIVVNGKTYNVNLNLPPINKSAQAQSHGTDFAALLEQQNQVKSEILEKGFGQYVADMQQKKLEEEIRAKILAALGLSEEEFNQLPAEQRAAIEQAVQEAIQKEMQARAQDENGDNRDKKGKAGVSVPLVAGLSMSG